ncbi:MAG: HAD family hydrolase [Deltaproteobacteria bacterium]|nr:HAD family hydrolase [Deltaproteobacteria bacterium]
MKRRVRLVITDLDNTLYDWVTFYVTAFYQMADAAAAILGVTTDRIVDDLAQVHRDTGNTEQPFGLLQAAVVQAKLPDSSVGERTEILDPAFHAFNRARKRHLQLYAGVLETIETIVQSCPLVALTEATAANAAFRLRTLGLDSSFDRIVAREDTLAIPLDPTILEKYSSIYSKMDFIPSGRAKPDPDLILSITSRYWVEPADVLYVGDSLERDVLMGNDAGVLTAWARYGKSYDPACWERLVRITCWTDEDLTRQREALGGKSEILPDITLTDGFQQLLDYVDFVPVNQLQSRKE